MLVFLLDETGFVIKRVTLEKKQEISIVNNKKTDCYAKPSTEFQFKRS